MKNLISCCCLVFTCITGSVANAHELQQVSTCLWSGNFSSIGRVGHYLYGGANGLYIFTLENPTGPSLFKRCPLVSLGEQMYSGNLLYDRGSGFKIFDISDTLNPVKISYPSYGIGNAFISGNFAYGLWSSEDDLYSHLRVVNISDPRNLVFIADLAIPRYAGGLFIRDTIAFVTSFQIEDGSTLYLVDISDFENMAIISSIEFPEYQEAREIIVSGNYAYIACAREFSVFNISQPTQPTYIGTINIGECGDMKEYGNTLFLYGEYGLSIIDISIPGNPVLTDSFQFDPGIADVWKQADTLYFVSHGLSNSAMEMGILDIADLSQPRLIGGYNMPGASLDVSIKGNYAYVANAESGIRSIDITEPANPVAGRNKPARYNASGIFIDGDYAFITMDYYIEIFDISVPDSFSIIGNINLPGWFSDIFVDSAYIYVAYSGPGIQIYSKQDISHPAIVGSYNQLQLVFGIFAAGDYLYACNHNSVDIIDISNPANPVLISSIPDNNYPQDVIVKGNYLFVTDYRNSMKIIDISNPSNPILVSNYPTAYFGKQVIVEGEYAFLRGYGGIEIVNVTDPFHPYLIDIYECAGMSIFSKGDMVYIAAADHFEIAMLTETGIDNTNKLPEYQANPMNYPNPFNGSTTIDYILPQAAPVFINMYNIMGQKSRELSLGFQSDGHHSFVWPVDDIPSGVIFYEVAAGQYRASGKMILIK
jgi:hypothetical protein